LINPVVSGSETYSNPSNAIPNAFAFNSTSFTLHLNLYAYGPLISTVTAFQSPKILSKNPF